jgi:nitroreductase
MKQEILQALQWRYATYAFDTTKKVSDEDLNAVLESGRLAPSSFGFEAWKFIVVKNADVRAKLRAVGYDQPRITDASDLIIIAQRTDTEHLTDELVARSAAAQGKSVADLEMLKTMAGGALNNMAPDQAKAWLKSQTYIPLGIMMETASLLNIDNAAMEGFNTEQVNEILGLSAKNLSAVTMVALGYRGEEPRPKARRTHDEVVEIIT